VKKYIPWILTVILILIFLTGHGMTKGFFDHSTAYYLHIALTLLIIPLVIIHILAPRKSVDWISSVRDISGWLLLAAILVSVISSLNWYQLNILQLIPFSIHLNIDFFVGILLVIHVASAVRFKKIWIIVAAILLLAALVYVNLPVAEMEQIGNPPQTVGEQIIPEEGTELCPEKPDADIQIQGVGTFTFSPEEIQTKRNDIFRECEFSLFDILVYLDEKENINMEYHFDESMNTHVIDSIKGLENWGYEFHYSGGEPETNVYRMDHHLYKEETYIKLKQVNAGELQSIYNTFKDEVLRKNNNDGKIIIPEIMINGKTFSKTFTNVEVTAHGKRKDVFQEDVITIMDVILSLGDQGKITYDLKWYDSIGARAKVVRSYWVSKINNDEMQGRCGFVYGTDAAQMSFEGAIHIPADTHVINLPNFVMWQWICV